MAEIGATLREARMRAGIDIAEVESRTKIRAKYLRALENEEWSLLPGTTFVKSFLRTYAEALDLDAKLLVEEYKFRHEPYESGGVVQRSGRGGGRRTIGNRGGGRRTRGGAFGPPKRTNVLPIVVLLLVVAGAIFAVWQLSKSEDEPPVSPADTVTQPRQETASAADRREARAAASVVALRIAAGRTEGATVCVTDARGRRVIDNQQLDQGRRTKLVRSKSFEISVGSRSARVTDGGERLRLTARKGVIAYRITKNRRTALTSTADRPKCSS
jgi:transcriptional regulator with XRE-family HTH domain